MLQAHASTEDRQDSAGMALDKQLENPYPHRYSEFCEAEALIWMIDMVPLTLGTIAPRVAVISSSAQQKIISKPCAIFE